MCVTKIIDAKRWIMGFSLRNRYGNLLYFMEIPYHFLGKNKMHRSMREHLCDVDYEELERSRLSEGAARQQVMHHKDRRYQVHADA